ncbi:thaumatin-like protein [Cubamyces sp. BRFM 1775]|nr:thaumatin-like protein [Cubamyces sp. BRFM 1775]
MDEYAAIPSQVQKHSTQWHSHMLLTGASIVVTFALASTATAERTFTIFNQCSYTIWPAIFTDLNVGSAVPQQARGWEQPSANVTHFQVPDNWVSGRIWARHGCDFSNGGTGPETCLTGGCNGGLECDPHTGTGIPPATLAEFTLGINGAADSYDVSVVDGHNIPMKIETNQNCPVAECAADLVAGCPEPLASPKDANGNTVGCKTACSAGLSGYVNSPDCCSGNFSTPATCPSSGVQYYSYFKGKCPRSYAYAFDESSGTALWSCDATLKADYTITFCPESS